MRLSRSYCLLPAIILPTILLATAIPALGAKSAFRYEQAQRVIKACVLYLEQPGGVWVNAHPGVIEGLRRSDLCPDDWVFENPLAEAAVLAGRGEYIVKGRPEYWRVNLTNDTAAQLSEFDLIYVCAPVLNVHPLSPQAKGLMQAVDGGALLWVDNRVDRASGTWTTITNFPWGFSFGVVDQTGEGDEDVLALNTRLALDATHSLLNEPYSLGREAVRSLGDLPEQWRPSDAPATPLWQRYPTHDFVAGFDTGIFRTVVQFAHLSGTGYTDRLPSIIAGAHGSGSVVVTAGDVGADVVEWIVEGLPGPDFRQKPDVQLGLNMIQWADRWEQARRRPAASATSVARAALPLEIDWQFPGPQEPVGTLNIGPVVGTPVHSRGMVFAVAPVSAGGSTPQLFCFDARPGQDLDFDREPDDGLLRCTSCGVVHDPREYAPGDACVDCGGALVRDFVDHAWGEQYDIVWSADLVGSPRWSSPTITTLSVPNEAGTFDVPLQVVLVSTVASERAVAGEGVVGAVTCFNATIDPNVLAELPAALRVVGAPLWSVPVVGYETTADVVALSTPIVHNGWVYVLATEYDAALPDIDGKTTERVYGRAHCFNLTATGPTAGWEYPTPVADIDASGPPAAGGPEPQRCLPPFHDPAWAADVNLAAGPELRPDLPPEPGALPIVTQAVDTAAAEVAPPVGMVVSRAVDALLTFGTTTTLSGMGGAVRTSGPAGGSEIALVPTPQDLATGDVVLNADYCLVAVNRAEDRATDPDSSLEDYSTVAVGDGTDVPGEWAQDADGNDLVRMVRYNPATVREVLAELSTTQDPTQVQLGAEVFISYDSTAGSVANELHFLPGPMRWRHEFDADHRRATAAAQVGEELVASTGVPVYYGGNAGRSGTIVGLDMNTGEERWSFDLREAFRHRTLVPDNIRGIMDRPVPITGSPRFEGMTAPAFDGDTAVVGATLVDIQDAGPNALTSSVVGIKPGVDATIFLRGGVPGDYIRSRGESHYGETTDDPDDEADVEVRLYAYGAAPDPDFPDEPVDHYGQVIDPECYRVDRYGRTITFPAETAGKVTCNDGKISLGPIYGKAVEVAWRNQDGVWRARFNNNLLQPPPELHVVPEIERFRVLPGFIRLRHYPAWVETNPAPTPPAEPAITRLDGTTVTGWSVVNPLGTAGTLVESIDGWIAMPAAVAGEVVEVGYTGFFEQDGAFYDIPNAALNLDYERHQVPGEFGPSISAPIITGNTLHMGTEGFTAVMDGSFDDPVGPADLRDTMLSMLWDRATGYVRTELSRPVNFHASYGPPTSLAAVSSSPSAYGDRVFVGSQILSAPGVQEGWGFVSGLKPRGLLVCDTTRLVQTAGTEPSWVCTASSGPQRLQSFVGEDLRRPFSRPAKATRLGNGNLLVVDTGNDRVVEIDEAGRLAWPLDELGYEYFTSSANANLRLSRPADADRYMGRRQVDTDGDDTPDTWITVWHTVIADTGNARVIDVETILNDPDNGYRADGRQRHTVVTLTPGALRLGGGERATRVRYTAAQPIFDPVNARLDGYLCAAVNLDQVVVVEAGSRVVNPAANTVPPSGMGTWARWAWLYDADPGNPPHVSNQPLLLRNIKHVEQVRYGDTLYVTVTCSRYDGRAGAGGHALAAAGAGVFEFRMNVGGAAGTWGLIAALDSGGSASGDEPFWHFVAGAPSGDWENGYNYSGGALRTITSLVTDAGTYAKRWFPVCAKRLPSGRHLVVNSLSQIENATHPNLGAASVGGVLGSHVFEVETATAGDNDPYNDIYTIPSDRSVPQPGEMWSDPISQPTYAEML